MCVLEVLIFILRCYTEKKNLEMKCILNNDVSTAGRSNRFAMCRKNFLVRLVVGACEMANVS